MSFIRGVIIANRNGSCCVTPETITGKQPRQGIEPRRGVAGNDALKHILFFQSKILKGKEELTGNIF